jgi:hypothetical protein
MRVEALVVVAVLSFLAPAIAAGQGVSIQGAAGSNIDLGGNTQAISVGVAAGRRVEFLVSGERIHVPTKVTQFPNGSSATRHGTSTFVSGEVRFLPLTFERISPYALAGLGAGKTRLNVNDIFPNPVTNNTRLMFFGGGLRVPVTDGLSVFGDLRLVLQVEDAGDGGLFLFAPVRGGIAWRF